MVGDRIGLGFLICKCNLFTNDGVCFSFVSVNGLEIYFDPFLILSFTLVYGTGISVGYKIGLA